MLIIAGTVGFTIWWIQRPIKPVVLSPKEKATVDAKLKRIEGGAPANSNPGAKSGLSQSGGGLEPEVPQRFYVPGSKVLRLTEREVNGLLNANTELGKSVRLEFDQDAVNAYVAVRIPDDFPIGAGKMFRARGRFRVSLGNGGKPFAILCLYRELVNAKDRVYSGAVILRPLRFQYRYPGTPISTMIAPHRASVGRSMMVLSVQATPTIT